MNKLRVLDLFSGIGGFSLGLEKSHFETVAFCEIDPYCRKVLAKHWPEIPIYEDVTKARFEEVGPVDMVTAGFPCQDISLAGQGAGLEGERSGLFWQILRTASVVGRPKLLLENVAALLDRGLCTVLGAMAQIGYDAEWHCIPACFVGAWTKRDRIWVYANPREKHVEGVGKGPIFEQSDLSREPARIFERWPGRSNLPQSRLAGTSDGLRNRLDAIGNTIVPQIPEMIGYAILATYDKKEGSDGED